MKKFTVNEELITQKLNNKTVIFDSERNTLYTLNETATQIFLYLIKGLDFEKIAEKISLNYQINPSSAKKDIDKLLDNLIKKKIIHTIKSSNS